MNFMIYDVGLLVLFVIFISIFLYSNRKNLKKEGFLFLYKADWGIKLINYVGKKYKKTLNVLSYVVVSLGYILMALAFYFVGKVVWVYAFYPQIVQAVKVPPIMPLLPYVTDIIDVPGLPSFYFIYWILILAIVAISHEFAHGIFAAYNKVRIKSTGFGFFPFFLPVFLAAFVEQDDEDMNKRSNFAQRTILAAGTFANVLIALIFLIILGIFFSFAYTPSGVTFDNYAYSMIPVASILSIDGANIQNPNYENIAGVINDKGVSRIKTQDDYFFISKELLERQGGIDEYIYVYEDAPAVKAGLKNNILEIDGAKIIGIDSLSKELAKHSPGEIVLVKATDGEEVYEYEIRLEKNPNNPSLSWLGIGFSVPENTFKNNLINLISFKERNTYYSPNFGDASIFFYNLLWWLVLISISVAIINMLPVGIFDGGRFFYLTILALTKDEKKAKRAFNWITYFFLFLLLLVMVFWVKSLF